MKLECYMDTYHLRRLASKLLPLAASACLAGNLFAQAEPLTDSTGNDDQAGTAEQQSAAPVKQQSVNLDPGKLNSIREYEDQVHRLETQYNAYHPGLSEAMTGLALAQQQEGDHKEAIPSLEKAIQISRVNYGLHHVNKIPLIEHLIVSYSATGDWQAVEDSYYKLTQLYSRNYNHNDLELLPGLAKLVKWNLFAYGEKLTEQPITNLLTAREYILRTINIIRYNHGVDDLRQMEAFSALLLVDFYLAVEQSQFQTEVRNPTFNSFQEQTNPVYLESGSIHMSMLTQGRRHIEAMIQITQNNPATPPRTAVDTLVILADWNLMFKQKMAADEIYRQAWEQAMALENHERHIEEIFHKPVRLPEFFIEDTVSSGASFSEKDGDDNVQDPDGNTASQGAIVFEFDISTSGRAEDPVLVESESDPGSSKADITRARRQLKSTRFRPRYESGIAVENQNVRIRYRIEPEPEQDIAEASNGE